MTNKSVTWYEIKTDDEMANPPVKFKRADFDCFTKRCYQTVSNPGDICQSCKAENSKPNFETQKENPLGFLVAVGLFVVFLIGMAVFGG